MSWDSESVPSFARHSGQALNPGGLGGAAPTIPALSRRQAQLRVEKHLTPEFGDLTANKLTSRHICEYIERRKREAANATINRELAIVRRAYNLRTLEDPPLVYRVPRIPKLKEDNVREGFLEPPQYRMILDGLVEPLKPVFVLGYHLGCVLANYLPSNVIGLI